MMTEDEIHAVDIAVIELVNHSQTTNEALQAEVKRFVNSGTLKNFVSGVWRTTQRCGYTIYSEWLSNYGLTNASTKCGAGLLHGLIMHFAENIGGGAYTEEAHRIRCVAHKSFDWAFEKLPEQPMPYQYKPGDRVKLVGKHDPRAGELGSITEVFHDSISHDLVNHVRVQLDNGDRDGFHVNNIQLVPQEQSSIKPGDRVRIVYPYSEYRDELGTVDQVGSKSCSVVLDGQFYTNCTWFDLAHVTHNLEVPTQQEQQIMTNAPAVELKTFVFGTDINKMTDDDLYGAITTLGSEIKRLGEIEPKPKKLQKKIEELKAQQQTIVELVDARES